MHHKAKRIGAVERQFIEGFITVLNREVDQIAQVFIFSLLCVQRRRHPAFGFEAIVVGASNSLEISARPVCLGVADRMKIRPGKIGL